MLLKLTRLLRAQIKYTQLPPLPHVRQQARGCQKEAMRRARWPILSPLRSTLHMKRGAGNLPKFLQSLLWICRPP